MILVLIGLTMCLIVYPFLLVESRKYGNVLIARKAFLVNIAGMVLVVVGLVVALLTTLI